MSQSAMLQVHGSCVAQAGAAVLLQGPPGSGKSDMVLRLLDLGFTLVADDRIIIAGGLAQAPSALRGMLEVRGLGLVRLPYITKVTLRLVVSLCPGVEPPRLPSPASDPLLGLPLIELDPWHISAASVVRLALRCLTKDVIHVSGAFAA